MRRSLAGAVCAALLWIAPAMAGMPAQGAKAPFFSLQDFYVSGQLVTSGQVFADHTTLVSFFATWCDPCKKELPHLKRLDGQYRARGFQVVLVCLDIMGVRNVKDYLQEAGATGLRVLSDKQGTASNQYGVVHLPTNVLVGPDESVIAAWDTYRPDKLQEMEAYLAKLPVRAAEPGARSREGVKP